MKNRWRDHVRRTAARALAAAIAVTTCMAGMTLPARGAEYGKNGTVRDMTSQQIVDDMGLGYNLGNTFDSIGSFITADDPWEYQKGWGNDPLSRNFMKKVKEGGFKTIRFPVSWAQWIDDNNQIDPGYMNAIQTVVDWCMEEDFYVILNIHHDSGAADTSWVRKAATDWDWTSKRYEAVWTQIAENFKGYGDHLIFEGMNEVEFPAASNMSKQYEILNKMNQLFVDTVRKTGGNNGRRHLLIPGYNTDIKKTCDRRYQFPEDPANHCILSIHYYSPSPFCVAEYNVDWAVPETTWGDEEDIKQVESDLDMLAENFISKGTPVIIGEYGVLTEDKKEVESVRYYVKKVPEIIMEYGMCPILWDTSNAGDMKYIERKTGEFYDPVIKKNYQDLARRKAAGEIKKREFDFPEYKRVAVPVSTDGWVSLASFQPTDIVGIAFAVGCKTGWDSYGGGGIYLDGWESTINFEFQSVYDEVKHIFTEEEKARLFDRLGVVFWWTDESGGGNRADSLYVKQFTLLYAENSSNGMNPQTAYAVGGGEAGGVGMSKRPNNSTEPAGKVDKSTVIYEGQLAEQDEEGWYHVPDTEPKPIGICFKATGGSNKYGVGMNIDADPYYQWIAAPNKREKVYLFGSDYDFTAFKMGDKKIEFLVFLYGEGEIPEDTEKPGKPGKPEEPDIDWSKPQNENEEKIKPEEKTDGEGAVYQVYEFPQMNTGSAGRRVPKAIRFKARDLDGANGLYLRLQNQGLNGWYGGEWIEGINNKDYIEYDLQSLFNGDDAKDKMDEISNLTVTIQNAGEERRVNVEYMIFIYPEDEDPGDVTDPEKPEEIKGYEVLLEPGQDGKYTIDPARKPLGIRFKAAGGSNAYGAGLQIDQDPWYIWIDFEDNQEKLYKFADKAELLTPYVFTEMKLVDKTVEYMYIIYEEPEKEEPPKEDPDPGLTEVAVRPTTERVEAKSYAVYSIPNKGGKLPVKIKFTFTKDGGGYCGTNLYAVDDSDGESYVGWIGGNSGSESEASLLDDTGNSKLPADVKSLRFELDGLNAAAFKFIYEDGSEETSSKTEETVPAETYSVYTIPDNGKVPTGVRFKATKEKADDGIVFNVFDKAGNGGAAGTNWWVTFENDVDTKLNMGFDSDSKSVKIRTDIPDNKVEIKEFYFVYGDVNNS